MARWAGGATGRRVRSTQSAVDQPDESVHEMLQQTCKDFVEAQLKPIASEIDKNHRCVHVASGGGLGLCSTCE